MNIYDFFRSQDIVEHCKKTEHVFSPLDMAVIVEISDKPMKDKHVAWREIISDYPDMPIHESLHVGARDSLHDYLQELIAWEERCVERFYAVGDNVVYRPIIYWKGQQGPVDDIGCYATAEEAWNTIRYGNLELYWVKEEFSFAKMYKQTIGNDFGGIEAHFNSCGEMTFLRSYGKDLDHLDLIFIHIPVPFEKGDIVTMYDRKDEPHVLYGLPHWWAGSPQGRVYEDFVSGKRGDGSDCLAETYAFIGVRGGKEMTLTLDKHPHSLPTLQYFKGELKGQERFLKHLSRYIKNKDDNIAWLISAFNKFQKESEFEAANNLFKGWYIPLEDEF